MIDLDYYLNFYLPALVESIIKYANGAYNGGILKMIDYALWYEYGEAIEYI